MSTPQPMSPAKLRSSTASPTHYFEASASSQQSPPTIEVTTPAEAEKTEDKLPAAPKGRLFSAVRSVMTLQSASLGTGGPLSPLAPRRQRTSSSTFTGSQFDDVRRKGTMDVPPVRGSRIAALTPKLKSLETTQDLEAHSGLVRHLQFSPNGKYLATSRLVFASLYYRKVPDF